MPGPYAGATGAGPNPLLDCSQPSPSISPSLRTPTLVIIPRSQISRPQNVISDIDPLRAAQAAGKRLKTVSFLSDKLMQSTNHLAREIPEDWLINLMQEKHTTYLDLAHHQQYSGGCRARHWMGAGALQRLRPLSVPLSTSIDGWDPYDAGPRSPKQYNRYWS